MLTLPPRAELQPVITAITERLACAAAGDVAHAPDWSGEEWRYACVVAHIHGIAPLLHSLGAGEWRRGDWSSFLAAQHHLNGQRHARIQALAHGIVRAAERIGVPMLVLKGVTFTKLFYADVALRPMADIDLFTPAKFETEATDCVEAAGYKLIETLPRHRIFILPPNTIVDLRGEHPDNPIKLELHTRVYDNLPHDEYDLTPLFEHHCLQTPARQPTLTDVMAHALMHASNHMMKRSLRFIMLYDLSLISRRLTANDWQSMCDMLAERRGLWWAYPPMQLMLRYFADAAPPSVQHRMASAASQWLRNFVPRLTVTDASFCNLQPRYVSHTLKWVCGPREAIQYLTERLSGKGRIGWQTSHKFSNDTQAFAPIQHPYRRMLRWLNPRAYRAGAEQMFG